MHCTQVSKRCESHRLAVAVLLALSPIASAHAAEPVIPELEFIGMQILPTGSTVDGIRINELSAIAYDPERDQFLAVNDSPGPGAARIYRFELNYDGQRFHDLEAVNARQLRYADGSVLPDIDAEGLTLGPGGELYVATEGRSGTADPDSRNPAVWAFDLTNLRRTGVLPVPEKFLPRDRAGSSVAPGSRSQVSGVQLNLGFEGLTISPDGNTLYVVNEAALLQDDDRGPFDSELNQAQDSRSRILRFDRDAEGHWQAGAEKVYRSDPGTNVLFARRFNSVSSLLAIDNSGNLLVLERGLIENNLHTGSYRIRIYSVNFNQPGTTDVADLPSLTDLADGKELQELAKHLVWEGSAGLDNIEGMTWGRVVDGRRTLVLVSDNNSSRRQQTQFLAFLTNLADEQALLSSLPD